MAIGAEVTEIQDNMDPPSKPPKPVDISEALEKVILHVGDMGTYQRWLFIGMLPFGFSWAFVYFGQMFITITPDVYWCRVPELVSAGISPEIRRELSTPIINGQPAPCLRYLANWSEVIETMAPPPPGTPTESCPRGGLNGFEFELEFPYYTAASGEYREWVCDRAYMIPLAQSINFFGSVVGAVLCGILADRFGRVPVLVLANMLGFLGSIATMFTIGFWDFAVCRFIVGMSCDSLFLMIYILVMEYVGISHRTWVANFSIALFFGGGNMALPWIAYSIMHWQYLSLAISLPMLLALAAPFLVPESARWLVSKGRIDEAVLIIKRFERVNKRKVPSEVMDDFVQIAKSHKEVQQSALDLFKTPSLRKITICLIIPFMSVAVVFDALIRLSEELGNNFYVAFTMSAATEIPSIALLVLLLDRFGRRKLVFVPSILAASFTFACVFVPRGAWSVALTVSARFLINMSYGTVIQWTPELLPTGVRASGASYVHMSAYAALVLSPFIVFSGRLWESLALVLVAFLGVVGGVVALLLPETAGKPMPQTMEDLEELASSRPYQRKRTKAQSSTNGVVEEGNS